MPITEELQKKIKELDQLIAQAKKSIASEPEGYITIRKISDTRNEYYLVSNETNNKMQYIRKNETSLISKMLQKRYDHKFLDKAIAQKNTIEKFLKEYDESSLIRIWKEIDPFSKNYVKSYKVPFETVSKEWKRKPYTPNPVPFQSFDNITLNNETVRSKSEVIIANCLREANVPYKYECPYYVFGTYAIYPDFTILDKTTGVEWYWEHFGKMDSEEYRKGVFKKLELFSNAGIFPGKRLITTFEDYHNHLNVGMVKAIIDNFFK